jgi:hypothetical protein
LKKYADAFHIYTGLYNRKLSSVLLPESVLGIAPRYSGRQLPAPLARFFATLAVWCRGGTYYGRNPANSITDQAGMYCVSTPITLKSTCGPVPGGRPRPVSVSASPRDSDPGLNRAQILTGAPNKVRGRSA